jgi:hypothetical protein
MYPSEFDEGHLKEDPVKAAEEIIHTLALMDDNHPVVTAEENPIRHVFQTTWYRIKSVSGLVLEERTKPFPRYDFNSLTRILTYV